VPVPATDADVGTYVGAFRELTDKLASIAI
jgi:hypothetical protein